MHYYPFTSARIFSVTGRHAERYLQARLTNDVRLITPAHARLAAALTPQGKTEGLFLVTRGSPAEFRLAADGGDSAALLAGIARFKVAEQLSIDDESNSLGLIHVIGEAVEREIAAALGIALPESADGAAVHGENGSTAVRRRRTTESGLDVLAPRDALERARQKLEQLGAHALSAEQYTARRIDARIPAFPEDVNDGVILAEAGIAEAVSFTKGCYVGQEVIAKIDALGKPPRLLAALYAPGQHAVIAGAAVVDPDEPSKTLGKVTSSAFDERHGCTRAFALLKNDGKPRPHGILIDGAPWSLA